MSLEQLCQNHLDSSVMLTEVNLLNSGLKNVTPTVNTNMLGCKDKLFKNRFDFTSAGDWDCVATVEHLPIFHFSVYFIFLSFGT